MINVTLKLLDGSEFGIVKMLSATIAEYGVVKHNGKYFVFGYFVYSENAAVYYETLLMNFEGELK